MRPCLALTLLASLAFPLSAAAEQLSTKALVAEMQNGGLVLYMRHAQTETDYADQVVAIPSRCNTQRMLSEVGWKQARAVGAAVAAAGIPVGEVISSEYCRAWQTADLAFGHYQKNPALNFEKAENYTDAQFKAMHDKVLPLLVAPVAAGQNRVIVGHDDPFDAAVGIYPEPQGVVYVLRPDGPGGAAVLGHIAPDDWPTK